MEIINRFFYRGLFFTLLIAPTFVFGQDGNPAYLRDRGSGQPTSMFGTYIDKGDLIIYPFYEYYYDSNSDYSPADFGGVSTSDFQGKLTANEFLIFLGYGFTDKFALEMEAAYINARFRRSNSDPENPGQVIEERGIGDVEGQLRYRWNLENERTPEIFNYLEVVLPTQPNKKLIGTTDWEFKLGTGIVKGFNFGTLTARVGVGYDGEDGEISLGECAFEYLKRVSSFFRFYLGVETNFSEAEGIVDLQFHFSDHIFLRVNNGFGITSNATDWAPEFGLLIRLDTSNQ